MNLLSDRVCGLIAFAIVFASAALSAAPKSTLVAPGVWRIRFGAPEKFAPLRFRSAPIALDGLKGMPVAPSPLDVAQTTFTATGRGCAVTLPMTRDEHIYGFGLSPVTFDMTGRRVFLRPTDHPETPTNDSHAPAPFYVSTAGYGVFVDTARYASFYTGDVDRVDKAGAAKTMLIDVPSAKGVDVYVFAGPTMLDAVRRYNLFSGGGCVPPLWGLGMFYRGLGAFTAEDSSRLARSFREQHIPCDVWGLEPGWQTKTYSCSFVWNTKGFPDPDGFIRGMKDMGYQLNVWQHAFTHPTSPIYEPLKPWSGDYKVWDGLVPDFATPEARKLMQDQIDTVLFSKGVSAVKLDECDYQPDDPKPWSFPDASSFPSGLDGEQMHSLFGLLYQQTMLEPMRKRNLRSWNLVRDSHALTASLPFALYSDTYEHKGYVRALAKQGFSGQLWCPEMRDTTAMEDLYRRLETVIFSPLAQVDSWFLKMPPWMQMNRAKNNAGEIMPEHEEVTATVRRLFELRMSLVPYLYSAFNNYRSTGTPPIRALVMDWPADADTYAVDDEFMFGPSLLVAPMFAGDKTRSVYLPAGEWFDFWTHERIPGGRKVDVSKPLDQIPVFVKAGTLLPLAKPTEHFDPATPYEVTVHVFGDHPAPFTLYEDDGSTLDFERGAQNAVTLTWDGRAGTVKKSGGYSGTPRYNVAGWEPVQ